MLTVRDAEEECIGYDMTYDPTDGKIYGIFYNDDMTAMCSEHLTPKR